MKLPLKSRRQLFIDRKVQGALLYQACMYWLLALVVIFLGLLGWQILRLSPRPLSAHLKGMWQNYAVVVALLGILGPVFIYDMVRLTNRFAGPMLRLRHGMQKLARGEAVEPMVFRQGDFWYEMAEAFNNVAARVQNSTNGKSKAAGTDASGGASRVNEPQKAITA
ncbi:MAG: hypothetical protein WD176_03945 [Pirellulales bacterium]